MGAPRQAGQVRQPQAVGKVNRVLEPVLSGALEAVGVGAVLPIEEILECALVAWIARVNLELQERGGVINSQQALHRKVDVI
jgi:hypothetical protein